VANLTEIADAIQQRLLVFGIFFLPLSGLKAASVSQGTAEQEVDLSVDTAQLVVGPATQGVEYAGIGA
jgi:hypothetical protein